MHAPQLANVPLFKDVAAVELEHILSLARERSADSGGAFFRQDDEATRLFVLVTGRAKIVQLTPEGQQIVLRVITPGAMFGCGPALSQSRYPGSGVAIEPATALSWTARDVAGLVDAHPTVARNALKILGHRIREIEDRYRELATECVERRLARTVLRLVEKSGRAGIEGVRIDFPLSRQDLAEMAGTTLHTVSRILSAWETRGVVKSGRQKVTVRDSPALQRIAEAG